MRYITLAIAFLICISADGQVIRAEPFYTAPQAAVSGNLLLDDYPGAAVAYSLRKLDKDYTGSAIRVRRSSDNTEQNIGFVNNYLDTAAMKTFVGANNGFVVTWYNQADSSGVFGVRNATQTTAANQPQIIVSGSINYDGNFVAIKFDGSDDYLLTGNYNFVSTGKIYVSVLASMETTNATRLTFALSDNSTYRSFAACYFQGTGSFASQYATDNTTARTLRHSFSYMANVRYLHQSFYDTNNAEQDSRIIGYQNNTLMGVNSWVNPQQGNIQANNKPLSIGADGLGNFRAQGKIQEILFYASDQSANQSGMASNANSFYSIY